MRLVVGGIIPPASCADRLASCCNGHLSFAFRRAGNPPFRTRTD
ncbi:hypothetical protein OH687_05735 [Burkholderia anthina]|nr:hypothetical protein OH687_05735 [Burkholderia anthina]